MIKGTERSGQEYVSPMLVGHSAERQNASRSAPVDLPD